MASDKELNSHYIGGYVKLLDEVKHAWREHPEAYDVLASVAQNYRNWVILMTGVKELPEVPSK